MRIEGLTERLGVIGLLVLISGLLSGSETAVFSLGRARREALAVSSRAADRLLGALLKQPARLIGTILVANELVEVAVAALATVLVAELVLPDAPRLTVNLVTTAVLVPVFVLFGEILPKSIAIKIPQAWSTLAARPLTWLAVALAPLRLVLGGVANLVARPFGVRPQDADEPVVREAEFRSMVDVGQEEGAVQGEERRLIHNVFEFADKPVGAIMTPGDKVFALSYDLPLARIADAVAAGHFSRVPVFRGRADNIVGILLAKDLVGHARGLLAARTLPDLLLPPFYVPKASRCDEVFRQMQRRRTHLAIVVDEYGRTVGLVTMEDLLGELFGDLADGSAGDPPRPADVPGGAP